MKNNLHVFLGATVADAAARPLHWVYNQKKLLTYIKGKKDFTFLKKNKSPFYNIKTGKVSGYNEVGQVMFKTLVEGNENIPELFVIPVPIFEKLASSTLSKLAVISAFELTKSVVNLNWSASVIPPKPVAVPELVIVAPDGIVIVSPDAPRVKDVPVLG